MKRDWRRVSAASATLSAGALVFFAAGTAPASADPRSGPHPTERSLLGKLLCGMLGQGGTTSSPHRLRRRRHDHEAEQRAQAQAEAQAEAPARRQAARGGPPRRRERLAGRRGRAASCASCRRCPARSPCRSRRGSRAARRQRAGPAGRTGGGRPAVAHRRRASPRTPRRRTTRCRRCCRDGLGPHRRDGRAQPERAAPPQPGLTRPARRASGRTGDIAQPTAWTPPSTCTISPVVAGNQSDSSADAGLRGRLRVGDVPAERRLGPATGR